VIIDNCRQSFCPHLKLIVGPFGNLMWVWVWEPCIDCSDIPA
jgi:hypothetical protein